MSDQILMEEFIVMLKQGLEILLVFQVLGDIGLQHF